MEELKRICAELGTAEEKAKTELLAMNLECYKVIRTRVEKWEEEDGEVVEKEVSDIKLVSAKLVIEELLRQLPLKDVIKKLLFSMKHSEPTAIPSENGLGYVFYIPATKTP